MKLAYPNIVIGGCLPSVIYAHQNKYSLICDTYYKPFRFDRVESLKLWSELLFEMSFRGQVLNTENIESVRLKEGNCKVVQARHQKLEIQFDSCFVFNGNRIVCDNEIIKHNKEIYKVYDWVNVRSCSPHETSFLSSEDNLAEEIYFYKSYRVDGSRNHKDIVTVSTLTKDQLFEFEYSDTMVKFKLHSVLKEAGILGSKSGYQKNGNVRRNSIKLEPSNREVFLTSEHIYKDSESIKFLNSTKDKDILLSSYA